MNCSASMPHSACGCPAVLRGCFGTARPKPQSPAYQRFARQRRPCSALASAQAVDVHEKVPTNQERIFPDATSVVGNTPLVRLGFSQARGGRAGVLRPASPLWTVPAPSHQGPPPPLPPPRDRLNCRSCRCLALPKSFASWSTCSPARGAQTGLGCRQGPADAPPPVTAGGRPFVLEPPSVHV